MGTLYNRTDIYDLFETDAKYAATKRHWEQMLEGRNVHSALDVSIGTGNLTLPLAGLGVQLSGSDLSEAMLAGCAEKARAKNLPVSLRQCDFREASRAFAEPFDLVISTGNSLPHVPNREIPGVLAQMDTLVKPGGYLYFDLRNWDKIVDTRQRFFIYDPQFRDGTRINLVQVWDHPDSESVIFNLLFTFERDNRIVQREIFEEHYHPVRRAFMLDALQKLGYHEIEVLPFPAQFTHLSPESTDWYCCIAKKPE